jgi:hypothetical protein
VGACGGQKGITQQIHNVTKLAVSGIFAVINHSLDGLQCNGIRIVGEQDIEKLFKLAVAVENILTVIRETLGQLGVFVTENQHGKILRVGICVLRYPFSIGIYMICLL